MTKGGREELKGEEMGGKTLSTERKGLGAISSRSMT